MATTTNYGWTTPDDTALVKDGAAAIRTLGSSVDTTTKNLNPETTLGDISYRSSTANVNTRLPLGTAGQVLKVNSGATAPEWATDASGMTNPMTTTGDTIYSSSGSTPARLGIGTTGQILTVAGGVPTWAAPAASASGLTKITSASFSAVSTLDIDSLFSATYKRYMIVLSLSASSSAELNLRFRAGGTTKSSSDYYGSGWALDRTNATFSNGQAGSTSKTISQDATGGNIIIMYFMRVGNTSEKPNFTGILNGGAGQRSGHFGGTFDVADTYTGINLFLSANNMTGDYQVYGLEN